MHNAGSELPRIHILGTGVKIDSAAAHFHGFGVARQGPWITSVNKGEITLPALTIHRGFIATDYSVRSGV
jgi:hypothetical protein